MTPRAARDIVRLLDTFGRGRVLEDYIVPGLRSTLLGTTAAGGVIRLFEQEREPELFITPHDHRYSFDCYVLKGGLQGIPRPG